MVLVLLVVVVKPVKPLYLHHLLSTLLVTVEEEEESPSVHLCTISTNLPVYNGLPLELPIVDLLLLG